MWAFVISDFSVRLVALNSHSMKPLIYKVAGTWGNHEGSMLLWMLILTLFGAMVAVWGGNLPPALKARVLSVQATIAVAFFAFILLTSNPFVRLAEPPLDGNDLNPLLQDPGLAFHPPFLYLGYVGLSMAYSFAIAALIEGRVDAAWARWVRPWTLLAWVFLTIGIAFGSIWAYYELGWGGWWFWDPVENVSFMPWLVVLRAAALGDRRREARHAEELDDPARHPRLLVQPRRGLRRALGDPHLGAFLRQRPRPRHVPAADPRRLHRRLADALRLAGPGSLRSTTAFAVVSRESGLVVNNLLLVVAAAVVFIGTVWPLAVEVATGRKVSVGPPFFDLAFSPFMIALAVILPVAAVLPWKRGSLGRGAPADARRAGAGAGARGARLGAADRPVDGGAGRRRARGLAGVRRADRDRRPRPARRGGRCPSRCGGSRNLPRADWGKALAHAGLGVTIFGVAAIGAWAVEDIRAVTPGESFDGRPLHAAARRGRGDAAAPNYTAETATVAVLSRRPRRSRLLHPEKRMYPVQGMATTEAAIDRSLTRDLYVALGDPQPGGGARAAHLRQALRQLDLGRGDADGARRRRQPDRPPLPRRRAGAPRAGGACRRNDPGACSWRWRSPRPALAVQPDEILPDPVLEARARAITSELRCVVCQAESIDDSNADIARDLRLLVRERHRRRRQRRSRSSAFVVDRYGEFVLFRPPFNARNAALWLAGPALLLVGGGARLRLHPPPRRGARAAPAAADRGGAGAAERTHRRMSFPPSRRGSL